MSTLITVKHSSGCRRTVVKYNDTASFQKIRLNSIQKVRQSQLSTQETLAFVLKCCKAEASDKVLHTVMLLVLLAGIVYFSYCLYYASQQFLTNKWNDRPAKTIDHLYESDPELKAIHERQVEEVSTLSSEITFVTAYYNLGSLNKGSMFDNYTPSGYKKWMTVFRRINNPLIVFTDSQDVLDLFRELRSSFPPSRTKLMFVNRTSLWAFSLAPRIKEVFSQPGYPNHDPNTVKETYSCVMHAKFELVAKVIKEKLFNTKYIGWIDIGLFRGAIYETHVFPLILPPNFDPDKVAYSGEHSFVDKYTPYQVIAEDKAWVGGAMFLGRPEVVYVYTQDYMRAVLQLLDENMMSTDQQVIYIMYLSTFHFQPRVEIQTYTLHSTDDWFYLGYFIKEMWDMKMRTAVSIQKFFHFML